LGNIKPRTLRTPKQWSFDMALSRSFQIKEAQRMEFRAEAYNVTNSFRPGCSIDPSTGVALVSCVNAGGTISGDRTSQFFGQLRNAREPRIMQFALKYVF